MNEDTPRSPSVILSEIKAKTQVLLRVRRQRDAGKFTSVGAALGLQKIEHDLRKLRAELPPLAIVT